MATKTLSANVTSDGSGKPGRRHFYGEPTIYRYIYLTADLKKRIEREANYRNARDDTSDWTFSRVVVDIVQRYFKDSDGR